MGPLVVLHLHVVVVPLMVLRLRMVVVPLMAYLHIVVVSFIVLYPHMVVSSLIEFVLPMEIVLLAIVDKALYTIVIYRVVTLHLLMIVNPSDYWLVKKDLWVNNCQARNRCQNRFQYK